ncbi:MAG: putative oxidoreductase [Cyclobacteriaceae bacterium]|jgi:predicted oxidoreductase
MRTTLSSDLSLSKIVAGFMNTGDWKLSDQALLSFIKENIALGITTMDHADIYGGYSCEALFGNALKIDVSIRQQMEIITKCGIALVTKNRPLHSIKHYNTSKEHLIWSVENSLKNLHTDYIDLLLIHRPDPLMMYEEIAEAFDELNKSGKVRNFGVSNFTPTQFNALQSFIDQPLVTNQIEISAGCIDAFQDGNIDFLQEKRVKPMAWSPLAGGQVFGASTAVQFRALKAVLTTLAAKYSIGIDGVMLAWLFNHPAGIIPVLGTGKITRIQAAKEALDVQLDRQEWFEIYTATLGGNVA